jgi:hypothetical protein
MTWMLVSRSSPNPIRSLEGAGHTYVYDGERVRRVFGNLMTDR